jgi:hypothetical protein
MSDEIKNCICGAEPRHGGEGVRELDLEPEQLEMLQRIPELLASPVRLPAPGRRARLKHPPALQAA